MKMESRHFLISKMKATILSPSTTRGGKGDNGGEKGSPEGPKVACGRTSAPISHHQIAVGAPEK